jgi:hypothetical protein
MEGMVVNNIGDYERINPRQFGNSLEIHMINLLVNWLKYLLLFSRSFHLCKQQL